MHVGINRLIAVSNEQNEEARNEEKRRRAVVLPMVH
jgi:hypothetical protein